MAAPVRILASATDNWGGRDEVSLYLDRCQVDSPPSIVDEIWAKVSELRSTAECSVVDFGAGDGRFAHDRIFRSYVGYEVDRSKFDGVKLPSNATIVNGCAFLSEMHNADICMGNPPYVRNQDLPVGWREHASQVIERRTGVKVSGLANAWQYFTLLALASTADDGLCALVIPFEWVSRPSAKNLRDFIHRNGWAVSTYRLADTTFGSVLTTASLTIIDKRGSNAGWRFFDSSGSCVTQLNSPAGSDRGVLPYVSRTSDSPGLAFSKRGLSPGTQKVLTLTEGERVRNALEIGRDVVPCVTSLRHIPGTAKSLTDHLFKKSFRDQGRKCWLIRTDIEATSALQSYLDNVPTSDYQTATCRSRDLWWKFTFPETPDVLLASSFTEQPAKCLANRIGAIAVGSVCGVYSISRRDLARLRTKLEATELRSRIVAHSNGLHKLEIGQINGLLKDLQNE